MPENVAEWTVLIVDDHLDNVLVAQTLFEYYGAQVYTASNGDEGIAVLQSVQPTVILMDLSMPRRDGWEAFRIIRTSPETAHIPVIAVTAHAMDGDRQRVLEAGFSAYIAKPYDINTLIPQIAHVLDQESSKNRS